MQLVQLCIAGCCFSCPVSVYSKHWRATAFQYTCTQSCLLTVASSVVKVFSLYPAVCLQPEKPAEDLPKRLHISKLTRNVTADHVKEIFSTYGQLLSCTLAIDERVQLPKGYAVVEYATREEAEKAREYMDGGQIDGAVIQ